MHLTIEIFRPICCMKRRPLFTLQEHFTVAHAVFYKYLVCCYSVQCFYALYANIAKFDLKCTLYARQLLPVGCGGLFAGSAG